MADRKTSPGKNTTSSTLQSLKERIITRQGLAKSNRFTVDFSAVDALFKAASPPIKLTASIHDYDDLSFFCETVSLPGRTTNTMDYGSWHHDIKIPIGYTEDDVDMTFILTNDYFIKNILDAWARLIINYDTYILAYDKDYRADIKIYQLNEYNESIYCVTLFDAYPHTVKAIDFDNSAEGGITKCGATFAYRAFSSEVMVSAIGAPLKPIISIGTNPFTPAIPLPPTQ